jgi:hypothetical protein
VEMTPTRPTCALTYVSAVAPPGISSPLEAVGFQPRINQFTHRVHSHSAIEVPTTSRGRSSVPPGRATRQYRTAVLFQLSQPFHKAAAIIVLNRQGLRLNLFRRTREISRRIPLANRTSRSLTTPALAQSPNRRDIFSPGHKGPAPKASTAEDLVAALGEASRQRDAAVQQLNAQRAWRHQHLADLRMLLSQRSAASR